MLLNFNIVYVCAVFFLLTLLLVSVSVGLAGPARKDSGGGLTRLLLVCLRLAIGWHFTFEAIDKLKNPAWSSEAYLRESVGPLGPYFRSLAGDRLVDQLTVGSSDTFPDSLDAEWDAYAEALANFYELDTEQKDRIADLLKQEKSKFVTWASVTKEAVELIGHAAPAVTRELTIPERLVIHAKLEQIVEEHELDLPPLGKATFETYKTAKTNLARWRAGLKKNLDHQTDLMKKAVREHLVGIAMEELPAEYRNKIDFKDSAKVRDLVRAKYLEWDGKKTEEDKETPLSPPAQKIRAHVLEKQSKERERSAPDKQAKDPKKKPAEIDLLDPLPPSVGVCKPLAAWSALELSDLVVKYGLLAVGMCLLVGLFTRCACVAGAAYLLMFYLAMPPMVGWPDPARAEGHYFLINKNIIEMLALLALATTSSGRWAGLDGLLQFLWPGRWRRAEDHAKLESTYREPAAARR